MTPNQNPTDQENQEGPSDELLAQYETVRQSGACNMLDRSCVVETAAEPIIAD